MSKLSPNLLLFCMIYVHYYETFTLCYEKKINLETTHLTIKICIFLLLPSTIFWKIAKNAYLQQFFSSLSFPQLSSSLQDLYWGLHFPSPQFNCSGLQPGEQRVSKFLIQTADQQPHATLPTRGHLDVSVPFLSDIYLSWFDSIQWQRVLCSLILDYILVTVSVIFWMCPIFFDMQCLM